MQELIIEGQKYISEDKKKKKNLLGKAEVESIACYGCEVWLFKREEQRKLLALVCSDYKKSQTPAFGANANRTINQSILDRIQRRKMK